jgi:thiosulfate reductase cytochrome b subunit
MNKYWLPALWLASLPLYAWAGSLPDRYAIDVERATSASYPLAGVLGCVAMTTAEAIALYLILRPSSYAHSWKRAAVALLLFSPWMLISFALLLHAPAYAFVHCLWLLVALLLVAGVGVNSLIRTWSRKSPARE